MEVPCHLFAKLWSSSVETVETQWSSVEAVDLGGNSVEDGGGPSEQCDLVNGRSPFSEAVISGNRPSSACFN